MEGEWQDPRYDHCYGAEQLPKKTLNDQCQLTAYAWWRADYTQHAKDDFSILFYSLRHPKRFLTRAKKRKRNEQQNHPEVCISVMASVSCDTKAVLPADYLEKGQAVVPDWICGTVCVKCFSIRTPLEPTGRSAVRMPSKNRSLNWSNSFPITEEELTSHCYCRGPFSGGQRLTLRIRMLNICWTKSV